MSLRKRYVSFATVNIPCWKLTGIISFYSQTCSYDHLYKMTNAESPKPIPIQLLLYRTTTCLTRPATIFLSPKLKKKTRKQPLQNFIQQRNRKQCIKNECLSDYIYSIATV